MASFENYLDQTKRVSPATRNSYIRDVERYREYLERQGQKDLEGVSGDVICGYFSALEKDGKSISTVMRTACSVKCYYSYLMAEGRVNENPARGVYSMKKKTRLPQTLMLKEVDLLLSLPNVLTPKGSRDKAMLELLYATGIRVSELISLNLEDVYLKMNFIRCRSGRRDRMIPIYPEAAEMLSAYLNNARKQLLSGGEEQQALFLNVSGERMTRQGFWKIIKHYKELSGIDKEITPHMLRHSFALHLLENGADLKMIQEMMGHADISSTQLYAKMIKSKMSDAYYRHHPRAAVKTG